MTTILTKKKDTTGAPAPGDLTNSAGGAELAVNTFDKRLYTKDSGGNVVEIGTNPSTIDTTTVDTTNLEVTNIKAKDGTAAATIANSTGKITVSTELAVDNLNLSGNTISSTDTNGAINLAPNGTGQVVFNAGAVGTPALTTTGDTNTGIYFPAADTIAFTEGGVEAMRINSSGNVGIGTSSPAYRLQVETPTATGDTVGYFRQGSGAVAVINSTTDLVGFGNGATAGETRIFADGASGFVTLRTNSTERMRITSAGNVGIGATSPNGRLEVVSTSAGANTNTLFLTNASSNASTSTSLVFGVSTAPTIRNATIQAINAGSNAINLAFLTSDGDVPAERMRITSAGNVGIGTTSPATRLDVRCVSDVTQDIAYFSRPDAAVRAKIALDGSGIINFGTSTNHPLAFLTNNTERMRITSGGNVGIGTTNPTNKFVVASSGAGYEIDQASIANTNLLLSYDRGASAYRAVANYYGSNYIWNDSGTERMRINSDGDLLVGTTNSSITAGQGFKAVYNSGTDPYVGAVMASSSNSQTNYHLYSTGAAAFRFYVGMGGTISATSATITTISDQRLKENIVDIDVGLDAVMALKPRKFDWKAGKGKDKKGDRGWIAQEFETVFPDMIQTWKDPAPEGEEPYKAVNADLIPVLVKAIQEQQQIINDLKARIETLESK